MKPLEGPPGEPEGDDQEAAPRRTRWRSTPSSTSRTPPSSTSRTDDDEPDA